MSELIPGTPFTGTTTNGVPFVAVAAAAADAPVIVAWHLLDPPRTPAAFAAPCSWVGRRGRGKPPISVEPTITAAGRMPRPF